MRFLRDERKRTSNLRVHGFDLRDTPRVFEGPTLTTEDDRFAYGERRLMTLGFVGGIAVSIVHTETPSTIRVISEATPHEEKLLFESLQD